MSKSNSEIASEILRGNMRDPSAEYGIVRDQIVLALAAAQSSLAKQVLDEIETWKAPYVMTDRIEIGLRELFARLNITIE